MKDGGEVLEFPCRTGVQRISKESIFSDLNNLVVSTALDVRFDERYGFTTPEVATLAAYLGQGDCADELKFWYDGYRFGDVDVYNPWSVLNYFDLGCSADVYWGNTSGNTVLGELVRQADEETLADIYALLEPGGVVSAPLDLGVVFPDVGLPQDALWSMLYLAGYLTTEDIAVPNNTRIPRRLRVPNHEISELYRTEVVGRFAAAAGGQSRLMWLHRAICSGDEGTVAGELARILRDSASTFDLTSENSVHMLLLGLLFGMNGYGDPESNREHGLGRPDIRIEPVPSPFVQGARPLVTIELKFARGASDAELANLARSALAQISERGYDGGKLPAEATGRVRWGIALAGKRVAVVAEHVG